MNEYRIEGEWIEQWIDGEWVARAKVAGAVRLAAAAVDKVIDEFSTPTAATQVAAAREVADTAARITQLEAQVAKGESALAAARLALAACAAVREARAADTDP